MYRIKRGGQGDTLIIEQECYSPLEFKIKPKYAIRHRDDFNDSSECNISQGEAFYLICSNFYN